MDTSVIMIGGVGCFAMVMCCLMISSGIGIAYNYQLGLSPAPAEAPYVPPEIQALIDEGSKIRLLPDGFKDRLCCVDSVVQLYDGTIVATDASNNLLTLDVDKAEWTPMPSRIVQKGCCTKSVTQAHDGAILGVGMDGALWKKQYIMSESWEKQPLPNSGTVKAVSSLADGKLLGVGTGADLWIMNKDLQGGWSGKGGCCVLSATQMKDPSGSLVYVGVGRDDNQLYKTDELTSTTKWTKVDNNGKVKYITVLSDKRLLGVGTDGKLYVRNTLTSEWQGPV